MARTTVGKLASKTAAVAKRVTAGAAKKATPSNKAAATKAVPVKKATPAKAAPAKAAKASAKKAPAKTTKAAVKKTTAPAKKTSTPEKAAASKKATTKKTTAKKAAPVESAPAKKSAAGTKAAPVAAAAKKSAPAKKAAAQKAAAQKAPAQKAPAKQAPPKKAAAKKAVKKAVQARSEEHASSLAVKADEDPWTKSELDEVRAELTTEAERLRGELDLAARELDDLMRDAGDGAGNDQADVGSTTFERDHEMSLANNARDMLTQTEHALERITDGTYGRCESCGQPIGKNRLMAFPRATLCLTCKQKEERR